VHGAAKNYEAAGHCAREQKNWEEAVGYFRQASSLYTENGTLEKVRLTASSSPPPTACLPASQLPRSRLQEANALLSLSLGCILCVVCVVCASFPRFLIHAWLGRAWHRPRRC
jgi:hypothetical protein